MSLYFGNYNDWGSFNEENISLMLVLPTRRMPHESGYQSDLS